MSIRYFTSESVTEGHPDKICDQISDRILDELLKHDPESRCACETTVEPGAVHVMGEITSTAVIDYEACAREVIRNIGYIRNEYGFTDQCSFSSSIHTQSTDIAMGVNNALESREMEDSDIGAGDQGMMFGYACNETTELMPLAICCANALTKGLTALRKSGKLPYLRPDGKSQVTVAYENGKPVGISAIVVSTQHDPDVDIKMLRSDIEQHLIRSVIPADFLMPDTRIYINPTGRFVLGGPAADTGLTGRKIIADTYGGYARHGGGAVSGKDPTKVDRSAAYMARYVAKHVVKAGLADKCELQISYAIGVARPLSVFVDTFGTGKVADEIIENWINENFDLRPAAIIKTLNLRRPIYRATAAYGHFGDAADMRPWEQIDDALIASAQALLE